MSLRTKLILIVGVIALAVWSFYPPSQKVNLGLDLKGGVHLVMRVNTDDALRLESETTAERLREALKNTNPEAKIEVTGPSEFRVEGIKDDQAFRRASADIESIFTRSSGTGSYTFTMRPNVGRQLREDTVNQALQTIERRVNELGVAEPIVARHGSNDQILVQLPGVADVNRAKEIIGRTAILELKLAEQGPFPTREAALQAVNNTVPPDMEIVTGTSEPGSSGGTPSTTYYIVKKVAAVTGRDLRNARPTLEERTVGPSLGADSIRAGVTAAVGGLLLVILFMFAYYKLAGLNAFVSIATNLIILLGMMAYLKATMTLPGIAGFILTIGMGVDSNVLIFERIKEELATAKGVRAAVNAGFDRVWWTIVDTHVSSLIAALFLFQFGTGPIRGFATTLFIGLVSNVFTAVFISRAMFEFVLSRRRVGTLSI